MEDDGRRESGEEARRLWAVIESDGVSLEVEALALQGLVNAHPTEDERVAGYLVAKLPVSLDDPTRLCMYLSACDALPHLAGAPRDGLVEAVFAVTRALKTNGHDDRLRSLRSAFKASTRYGGLAALPLLEEFLAPDEPAPVWRVALKWACLTLVKDVPAPEAIPLSMRVRVDAIVAELAVSGRERSSDEDRVLGDACTMRIFADRMQSQAVIGLLAQANADATVYRHIVALVSIACANWKPSSMLDAVLLHEGMQELERACPKPVEALDEAV